MKIIFFGTSSFVALFLEVLRRSRHTLLAVVTQTEKRGGRYRRLLESPVKQWALEKKIACLQPANLSDPSFIKTLREYHADLFLLVSYGKILPPSLLALPPQKSVNVHPSLLPKYRGASPIPWAILNGDAKTGVSVIRMVEEIDAGEILLQKELAIGKEEDTVHLSARLSQMGSELLIEVLRQIQDGKVRPFPQKGKVTLAPRFKKEDGAIDWTKPAVFLARQIRALIPWPGCYGYLQGKRILIWKAEAEGDQATERPGEVVDLSKEGTFRVATGKGRLLLKAIQLEGKERMDIRSFLAGHPVALGETFSCNP